MTAITTSETTTARERADAIRSGIDATAAALQEVPRLVIEAFKAEDWRTLDYESWGDYVKGEFGTSLLKLDKATRKTWTLSLKEAGMSTREIAPVTNVSQPTVSRDLSDSDESRQPRQTPQTPTGTILEYKISLPDTDIKPTIKVVYDSGHACCPHCAKAIDQ
jgi:hypothetical protein